MKIDGYARISVDLQEDSHENTSIENQKRIIRDFVAKEFPDAELTIYEDRDRSGYTFSQRENYQKMRKELINGDVRILIVKDFSRFSRRNSLGLLELETLRDAGIRIISIGDNIDYPTRDDWMLIQFKFLMNEMPVTDTSKKIKQMIDNRQKNGQWICAVPYGYRITNTKEMTYEIDPPAAEVVREVFRLYNLGWGYKKIANHLTDSGVPTPRANEIAQKEAEGKATKLTARSEWSIITVQAILKNDFYIGTLRQRKYTRKGINGKDVKLGNEDNIVIENAHEPIVDGKTFAYTKEQLELRSIIAAKRSMPPIIQALCSAATAAARCFLCRAPTCHLPTPAVHTTSEDSGAAPRTISAWMCSTGCSRNLSSACAITAKE